jgi:MoaA/NifB/PqqE/SkfB family radical SAM enzyme
MISISNKKPFGNINEKVEDINLKKNNQFNLHKLYIEPTNFCNLNCRTCVRNSWNEPLGHMSDVTWKSVLKGLRDFSPTPKIFFGGFGEPLSHPRIIEMVIQAKQMGATVELITNGTLLTPEISEELLEAKIDLLWVSLDGATPESYSDIRSGANLSKVINNIAQFNEKLFSCDGSASCCGYISKYKTQLGIAFVAMKSNIGELPAVLSLGQQLGVKHLMVTNVLPYTEEMGKEILYSNLRDGIDCPSLTLPRMSKNSISLDQLNKTVYQINWMGGNAGNIINHCPFIVNGAGVVSWDGNLSPCLPLMHSHTSYVLGREYNSQQWVIGNIYEHGLGDLWWSSEHMAFRERVNVFPFPPCTSCGGCELVDDNKDDCYGNKFPVCGNYLWAQGVIQCP